LHQVLDGDGDAVLIGHDWVLRRAYGAAASAPDRWRRLVTLAVPPPVLYPVLFSDYQLKRFFSLFRDSLARVTEVVATDQMAFLGRPWRNWSLATTRPRTVPGPKRACGSPRVCRRRSATTASWRALPHPAEEQVALGRPVGRRCICTAALTAAPVELIADAERLLPRARA
jgi:pimeloyl-ACP methyl ester carboxylesterase